MKLTIYNKENCGIAPKHECTLRVAKRGECMFSATALKLIGLQNGDKVNLANEEGTKNWYITKVKNDSGFEIRRLSSTAYGFRNKVFSVLMLKSLKLEDSASFLICKEPINIDGTLYYQLITTRPIIYKGKNTGRKKCD